MVDPVSINQAAAAYGNASRVVENVSADATPGIGDFSSLVSNALSGAVGSIDKAEAAGTAAALGGSKVNLSDLVTAISSAELALSTIIAIRDRAVSAYQDIIKMPI